MRRLPFLSAMPAGAAVEGLAGLALWQGSGPGILLAAAALHSLSSYLLARGLWQLLPRRYRLPARRTLGFLFVIVWILPVIGPLGLLVTMSSILRQPRSRFAAKAKIIALPELPFSPPVIFPVPPYSAGALRQIVHFAARPLKRLKAVMATRQMTPREAMKVWSRATRDPVDDVRLLAFAMRDNSEKKLADRIQTLNEALPNVPLHRRGYHKAISASCWELVYHRLVQGVARRHWLQVARHHMEYVLNPPVPEPSLAEESVPTASGTPREPALVHDANSWLLYGRILLESADEEPDDLILAKKAFGNARTCGADEQKILPWFAEVAFRERRFSEVKRCLQALSHPGEKGRDLAQVKAWWTYE
jgi:hypothetical protein